jgi:SRSO17 transposase
LRSNAPWAGQAGCGQMQAEIKATAALAQGRTLMLDERADEQAGTHNAGASRPDKGRMGKVDLCRVATCLAYANGGLGAMGEGALFWPEAWCGEAFAQTRHERGIPPERTFATKLAVGLKMITRVKATGGPFDVWAGDALDGRDSQFRADGDTAGVLSAAQVPADPHVYVSAPHVGVPAKRGTRGRPRTRLDVLSRQRPHEVRALAHAPQPVWQQVVGRHPARGRLVADVAVQRVWTVAVGQRPRAEWLVIRRDAEGNGA